MEWVSVGWDCVTIRQEQAGYRSKIPFINSLCCVFEWGGTVQV